jgi:hypothetical protein
MGKPEEDSKKKVKMKSGSEIASSKRFFVGVFWHRGSHPTQPALDPRKAPGS